MLIYVKIIFSSYFYFENFDLVSVQILPDFELIRYISEMDIWYTFWSNTWIALTEKLVHCKWPQVGHFEFDQVEIFHGISLHETAHFFL